MAKKRDRAAAELSEPLPRCKGPKLRPFTGREGSIRFIRLLGDLETGHDGHVFEVEMGSNRYALKLFRFYDPGEHRMGFLEKQLSVATDELIEGHFDPFYAECRAFGRIEEKGLNGRIAVRCYGFMAIPAAYERELARKFGADEWDRPEEEYTVRPSERQPFRAIVKELVNNEVKFTRKTAGKMARDLRRLRKMGVYPMDIRTPNYKDARLLDFSVSHTTPHLLFQFRSRRVVKIMQHTDLVMFDEMMGHAGMLEWARMLPNEDYCQKLRSRGSDE